jgi:hypothetical protein
MDAAQAGLAERNQKRWLPKRCAPLNSDGNLAVQYLDPSETGVHIS